MYTLRDDMAKDFVGTLRKVAEIGYPGVQLSGNFGGLSGPEIKKVLADLNLKIAATHVGLEALEQDIKKVIDFNLGMGNVRVAIGALPGNYRHDKEGYLAAAKILNKVGKELKENGIELGYHNHSFEFTKFDGQYAYDILFEATDPEFLKAEIDTYWVQHGGADPAEYIRKYAGRTTLLHLKDMAPGPERHFAEVGEGILDWDAIFAAASESACAWYLVEQDTCQRPPIESVRISFENLKKFGIA